MAMTLTVVENDEGADRDPVQELAGGLRRLVACGQHFRNLQARELQLGPTDLVALGHLHSAGSMAPKELSALMGVTSGTMTALLDRVEKAGFLKRERNPDDRRGLLIHLTPAGQHSVQWVYEQFDSAIRHTLDQAPELSIDQLRILLEKLSDTLEGGMNGSPVPGQAKTAAQDQPLRLEA